MFFERPLQYKLKIWFTHNTIMKKLLLTLSAFAAVSSMASNASDSLHYSVIDIDAVSVTSFKQIEKTNVAASSSIVNSVQLKNFEMPNIKDLSAVLPNFFMPDYGSKQSSPIFIRGIGSKLYSSPVGLYIDGVPHFEKSAFDFDLADVSGIELLRGPQGTLYGRNTAGGIINITTPSPMDVQYTSLKLSYANQNDIQAMVSSYNKLGDKFGLSLMANYRHHDGYFENVYTGENADKLSSFLGRVALVYKPNNRWQMRLNTSYDYTDQNGYPYGLYNDETGKVEDVSYDFQSLYLREILTAGFNAKYTGEKYSFNSQSSYQRIDDNQKIDQDFSTEASVYVHQKSTQNLLSQEFTFKSNTSSRYQHITGLFAFWQGNDKLVHAHYLKYDYSTPKYYDSPTMGVALYHQSSFEVTSKLTALVGLRYDYEYAEQDYQAYKQTISDPSDKALTGSFNSYLHFDQLTPKFTLKYEFSPRSMFYGSVTKGYKAGGFNTTFLTDDERAYDPEHNWNYEIGTKQSFWDGKLTTNLTLFYIDWQDQQVSKQVDGLGYIMQNAARSQSKGVEFSFVARPTQNISISANYGFTDAKFTDYVKDSSTDYSGNYLALVPRHTASLQASYTFYDLKPNLSRLMFSAGATGAGKIYWDDANEYAQDFYTLLNFKASAEIKERFTVELWGKNITNTDYVSYMFTYINQYAQSGKPTSVGCSLIYKF